MSTKYVSSGVTSTGLHLGKGSELIVLSGGAAADTTVSYGGQEVVSAGGTDTFGVLTGGYELLLGTATGTTLSGALVSGVSYVGSQQVGAGGSSVSATVAAGGVQTLSTGGGAFQTVVLSGGEQTVEGGTATSSTLSMGEQLVDQGVAIGTVLTDDSLQQVGVGGSALATSVTSSTETVAGLAEGTIVYEGGLQTVSGTALDTTVFAGEQMLESGGYASNTYLIGTQSGGKAYSAEQYIGEGAQATDIVAASGGYVMVGAVLGGPASASDITVLSGGELSIQPTATVSGAVVSSGGTVIVWNGATISGLKRKTGSFLIDDYQVGSGVSLSGVTVRSGAIALVDGGALTSTHVISGGAILEAEGTMTGTAIYGGGQEIVSGLEIGSVLKGTVGTHYSNALPPPGDAWQDIASGGVVSGARISAGGLQTVDPGGTAVSCVVCSGGVQQANYGMLQGTIVSSGGVLRDSGAEVSLQLRSGGLLEISYDMAAVSITSLQSGALIDIDGLTATSAAITSGKLVFTSGGQVEGEISVSGATSHLTFTVESTDGNTQVVVGSTAAPTSHAALLQAAAGFKAGWDALQLGARPLPAHQSPAPVLAQAHWRS